MTEGSFVPLPGSERETISGVQDIGPVDPGERIEVTLIIRRRAELPAELVIGPATISTEELASTYGADPADIDRDARSWPVTAWRSPALIPVPAGSRWRAPRLS